MDGIWYEIKKDKFTSSEFTGKCNRTKMSAQIYDRTLKTGNFDYSKPLDSGE